MISMVLSVLLFEKRVFAWQPDIIKKGHQEGADLNMTGTTKHIREDMPLYCSIIHCYGDTLVFLVELSVDPHVI